jgi:hypothetical protein
MHDVNAPDMGFRLFSDVESDISISSNLICTIFEKLISVASCIDSIIYRSFN